MDRLFLGNTFASASARKINLSVKPVNNGIKRAALVNLELTVRKCVHKDRIYIPVLVASV